MKMKKYHSLIYSMGQITISFRKLESLRRFGPFCLPYYVSLILTVWRCYHVNLCILEFIFKEHLCFRRNVGFLVKNIWTLVLTSCLGVWFLLRMELWNMFGHWNVPDRLKVGHFWSFRVYAQRAIERPEQ